MEHSFLEQLFSANKLSRTYQQIYSVFIWSQEAYAESFEWQRVAML